MLTKAPATIETWASYFAEAPIPVLAETASALAELAPRQEDMTVSQLAPLVLADPLMTVKLLAYVAKRRSARALTGSETVAQAILMMGMPPFFYDFREAADLLGLTVESVRRKVMKHDDEEPVAEDEAGQA